MGNKSAIKKDSLGLENIVLEHKPNNSLNKFILDELSFDNDDVKNILSDENETNYALSLDTDELLIKLYYMDVDAGKSTSIKERFSEEKNNPDADSATITTINRLQNIINNGNLLMDFADEGFDYSSLKGDLSLSEILLKEPLEMYDYIKHNVVYIKTINHDEFAKRTGFLFNLVVLSELANQGDSYSYAMLNNSEKRDYLLGMGFDEFMFELAYNGAQISADSQIGKLLINMPEYHIMQSMDLLRDLDDIKKSDNKYKKILSDFNYDSLIMTKSFLKNRMLGSDPLSIYDYLIDEKGISLEKIDVMAKRSGMISAKGLLYHAAQQSEKYENIFADPVLMKDYSSRKTFDLVSEIKKDGFMLNTWERISNSFCNSFKYFMPNKNKKNQYSALKVAGVSIASAAAAIIGLNAIMPGSADINSIDASTKPLNQQVKELNYKEPGKNTYFYPGILSGNDNLIYKMFSDAKSNDSDDIGAGLSQALPDSSQGKPQIKKIVPKDKDKTETILHSNKDNIDNDKTRSSENAFVQSDGIYNGSNVKILKDGADYVCSDNGNCILTQRFSNWVEGQTAVIGNSQTLDKPVYANIKDGAAIFYDLTKEQIESAWMKVKADGVDVESVGAGKIPFKNKSSKSASMSGYDILAKKINLMMQGDSADEIGAYWNISGKGGRADLLYGLIMEMDEKYGASAKNIFYGLHDFSRNNQSFNKHKDKGEKYVIGLDGMLEGLIAKYA